MIKPTLQTKRKIALALGGLAVAGAGAFYLFSQGCLPLRTLSCSGRVSEMRFSPNGKLLAAQIDGKGVVLWDTKHWTRLKTLPGKFLNVTFTSDGQSLMTFRFHGGPGAEFIDDNKGITTRQWAQVKNKIQAKLERWDVGTGQKTEILTMPACSWEAMADKARLAVFHHLVSPTGISVVDIQNGREVRFLPTSFSASGVISPDGRWLYIFDNFGKTTKNIPQLWDTQTWQKTPLRVSDNVYDANFSPGGHWLALAGTQTVQLWHVGDWQPGPRLSGNYQSVLKVNFSPDSKQVIGGGDWTKLSQNPAHTGLTVWDTMAGRKKAVFDKQDQVFWNMTSRGVMSQDQTNYEDGILWNTRTGRKIWQGNEGYFPVTAVSPDGRTLLIAYQNSTLPSKGQGFIQVRHLPGS